MSYTACRVILLYEARVTNSLLGKHSLVDWTAVLDVVQVTWGLLVVYLEILATFTRKQSGISYIVFES